MGAPVNQASGGREPPGLGMAKPQAPLAGAVFVIVVAVVGCSLYANLSFLVKSPADFRFFPPFERGVNKNDNIHLGAEYNSIAGAIVSGRGFADPFQTRTGKPTAWMPPVLPCILAALRWAADGDLEMVMALVVLLQDLTLIGTGLLVLALARQITGMVWVPTVVFLAALAYYFRLGFQHSHDCWIVLAVLDLLIAGLVWARPLARSWRAAAGWGAFGGFCALTSPVVGFTWGILALATGLTRHRFVRLTVAALAAGLTVTPWVVRNYLAFDRFIPVKSNLAFELHQSQCLTPDGVLRSSVFATHPFGHDNQERWAHRHYGEMAYVDQKWDLFKKAVQANPADFADRMANRFLAATLVYVSFDMDEKTRRPWSFRLNRWVYPLPFACLLFLLLSNLWRPLHPSLWIIIGVYLVYLLPYVVVSFYDRYKFPVVGAEVTLIVCALHRTWAWLRALAQGESATPPVISEPFLDHAEPEPVPAPRVAPTGFQER